MWVATITRSFALDRLRTLGTGAPLADVPGSVPEDTAGSPQPEFAWLQARSRSVRSALESLPSDQRTVIEIAYFEGLAAVDIARRVGVSTKIVTTRIRQGMMSLRETLSSQAKLERP